MQENPGDLQRDPQDHPQYEKEDRDTEEFAHGPRWRKAAGPQTFFGRKVQPSTLSNQNIGYAEPFDSRPSLAIFQLPHR